MKKNKNLNGKFLYFFSLSIDMCYIFVNSHSGIKHVRRDMKTYQLLLFL